MIINIQKSNATSVNFRLLLPRTVTWTVLLNLAPSLSIYVKGTGHPPPCLKSDGVRHHGGPQTSSYSARVACLGLWHRIHPEYLISRIGGQMCAVPAPTTGRCICTSWPLTHSPPKWRDGCCAALEQATAMFRTHGCALALLNVRPLATDSMAAGPVPHGAPVTSFPGITRIPFNRWR
jgi:hypothetical protein